MTGQKLREIILANREEIKYLMLSKPATDLMDLVMSLGETTSSDVSQRRGISLPSASLRLRDLHNRGYLKRKKVISKTGGIEYIYKSMFLI